MPARYITEYPSPVLLVFRLLANVGDPQVPRWQDRAGQFKGTERGPNAVLFAATSRPWRETSNVVTLTLA